MTMTIEIPALDRLCDILEERRRGEIIAEMKNEIARKLKEAAEGGVPRPKFEEVPAGEDHPWKEEAENREQGTGNREQERPTEGRAEGESAAATPQVSPETRACACAVAGAEATAAGEKAKEHSAPVTLEAVQKAAAQMRDEGKLKAVTELFPEFGIKRLSDLKGDALQQFAERLRKMGAKI